ncbi:MAG: hypothetical protein IPI32_08745 [Austwickia sp.]|nr:hypothetical protein [Austwickia sp.]
MAFVDVPAQRATVRRDSASDTVPDHGIRGCGDQSSFQICVILLRSAHLDKYAVTLFYTGVRK